jgi:hypothetical protein
MLLHSHFPVRDDEILLEEAHTDPELITLRPVSEERPCLVATSVCFDGAGDPLGLIGLEFTSEETLAGVRPLGGQDREVLTRLYEISIGIKRPGGSGFAYCTTLLDWRACFARSV